MVAGLPVLFSPSYCFCDRTQKSQSMYSDIKWKLCRVLKSLPNKFLRGCQMKSLFPIDFCLHWFHIRVLDYKLRHCCLSWKNREMISGKQAAFPFVDLGKGDATTSMISVLKKTSSLYFRTQREKRFCSLWAWRKLKLKKKKKATYPKQTLVAKRMPKPGAEFLCD